MVRSEPMKDEGTSSSITPFPGIGAVLAFDFGEKRIGVAQGDLQLKIAHPLTTIQSEVNERRFVAIGELISEHRPALLVVGLPVNDDGSEHEMSRLARKFAQRLAGRFNVRTVLVNEYLSSASAESALAEAGVHGKRQKLFVDQVAAQQILQSFFNDPKTIA
jgi:putative Holliday junction resolvase